MKKIFAYTKEAKLGPKAIGNIAAAGYVPVPVENLDCIRIIEPLPDSDRTLIFNAAVKAMLGDSFGDIRKVFATTLLKDLAAQEEGKKGQKASNVKPEIRGEK